MEKLQATEGKKQRDISEEMLKSLPIVSCGGSDGHIDFVKSGKEKDKIVIRNPFVDYQEKEDVSEEEKALLESFLENIRDLEPKINRRFGGDVVKVEVKSEKYGKGRPVAHTIRFLISKNISTMEKAQIVFETIRDEFSNYLNDVVRLNRS